MLDIKERKKAEESSLFHVICHVIWFSAQMNMLRKIIDCEIFEISQENFYDEVSFSNKASLQLCYKENPPHILFGICIEN